MLKTSCGFSRPNSRWNGRATTEVRGTPQELRSRHECFSSLPVKVRNTVRIKLEPGAQPAAQADTGDVTAALRGSNGGRRGLPAELTIALNGQLGRAWSWRPLRRPSSAYKAGN